MSSLDTTRPTSTRIVIARLAEQVVAVDPGVGFAREGGRRPTRDGDRMIPGVVVTAAGDGRVDVDLHLIAYIPPRPFPQQARALREALVAEARRAGVAESLGAIDITIHDLLARGEPDREGTGVGGAGAR